LLIFFGLLLVGYIYLWRRGDLDWVRTTTAHNQATVKAEAPTIPDRPVLVAIGK
jgi:NADH-quinone oxidoreductase subunit A